MKLLVNKLKIIRIYPNLEFEGDVLADKLSDAAYEDVKAENIQKIKDNKIAAFMYNKDTRILLFSYDKKASLFSEFGTVFGFCFDTSGIDGYRWQETWIYGIAARANEEQNEEGGLAGSTWIHTFNGCCVKVST